MNVKALAATLGTFIALITLIFLPWITGYLLNNQHHTIIAEWFLGLLLLATGLISFGTLCALIYAIYQSWHSFFGE